MQVMSRLKSLLRRTDFKTQASLYICGLFVGYSYGSKSLLVHINLPQAY